MEKITKEQAKEVLEKSIQLREKHPELRKGQAFMNTLQRLHEKVYRSILWTKNDTHYNDEGIDECKEYICQ